MWETEASNLSLKGLLQIPILLKQKHFASIHIKENLSLKKKKRKKMNAVLLGTDNRGRKIVQEPGHLKVMQEPGHLEFSLKYFV